MTPLPGYSFARRIKVGNAATLAETPQLIPIDFLGPDVDGNPNRFPFEKCLSSGWDIRFTDDQKVLLPFFRPKGIWDRTGRIGRHWVLVNPIPSGGHELFVHFGNPSATDGSSVTGALAKPRVDSNTLALFNFDEGAGTTFLDETGTYTATKTAGITWHVGDAMAFEDQEVNFGGHCVETDGANATCITIPGLLQNMPAQGSILMMLKRPTANSGANPEYLFSITDNTGTFDKQMTFSMEQVGGFTRFRAAKGSFAAGYDVIQGPFTMWPTHAPFHIALTWGPAGFLIYTQDDHYYGNPAMVAPPVSPGVAAIFHLFNRSDNLFGLPNGSRIDCLKVMNRQITRAEFIAFAQCRDHYPVTTPYDRLVKSQVIAGFDWMAEPHDVDFGGAPSRLYWSAVNPNTQLRYLSFSTGANYDVTTGQAVLGDGVGINNANRACFIVNEFTADQDGNLYCFFSDNSGDSGSNIRFAVSFDGEEFEVRPSVVAAPVGSILGWANIHVEFDNGSFEMIADTVSALHGWVPYHLRATSITTPDFVVVGGPLTNLNLSEGVGSGSGGTSFSKVGDRFLLLYHQWRSSLFPSDCRAAWSYDLDHNLRFPFGGIIPRTSPTLEFDQTADPKLRYNGTDTIVFYEGNQGQTGPGWSIRKAVAAGMAPDAVFAHTITVEVGPSSFPLSTYVEWDEFIRRWGLDNVRIASNKQNKSPEPDYDAVQDSFDYADAEIDAAQAGGIYASPLNFGPNGNTIPKNVKRWASTIAYADLYESRGLSENDKVANKIHKLLREVYAEMALVRSGVKQIPAMTATSTSGDQVGGGITVITNEDLEV